HSGEYEHATGQDGEACCKAATLHELPPRRLDCGHPLPPGNPEEQVIPPWMGRRGSSWWMKPSAGYVTEVNNTVTAAQQICRGFCSACRTFWVVPAYERVGTWRACAAPRERSSANERRTCCDRSAVRSAPHRFRQTQARRTR